MLDGLSNKYEKQQQGLLKESQALWDELSKSKEGADFSAKGLEWLAQWQKYAASSEGKDALGRAQSTLGADYGAQSFELLRSYSAVISSAAAGAGGGKDGGMRMRSRVCCLCAALSLILNLVRAAWFTPIRY